MPDYTPDFLANKTHGAASLYTHRNWYKIKTSQIFQEINNNQIDLWYDVPYYGKVNQRGILYIPKPNKLELPMSNQLITFDFVAQAFHEFRFFMKRAIAHNKTSIGSLLGDIQAKNSFFDAEKEHMRKSYQLVEAFNKYIVDKEKPILDFEAYICEYLKFAMDSKRLITLYSVYAGPQTPVNATGLAINLLLNKNNNDDNSKNAFFQDSEFAKYITTAANFGFRVNKNAPWMLIADLNSAPMKSGRKVKEPGGYIHDSDGVLQQKWTHIDGYLQQHFIYGIDYMFNNYYNRLISTAFSMFKFMLIYGYKEYQNRMKYLIIHVPAEADDADLGNYKYGATGMHYAPLKYQKHYINDYKTSNSENITSFDTDISDINNYPKFTNKFFINFFEKVLKYEFNIKENRQYKIFKRRLEKQRNISSDINVLYDILEHFYSPVRIFNMETYRPDWRTPKKSLTPKKHNVMIPNEKQKPSIGKIVTEFYTGH
jgi:hypothetical protein